MKYRFEYLGADTDTLGSFYVSGINDADTVYMANQADSVGLNYYSLPDNSAGCGYINIPLTYAECEQFKDLRIAPADANSFGGTYIVSMYINQKTKAYKIEIESVVGDKTVLVSKGNVLSGDYETHKLRVDWKASNSNKTGLIIGCKDKSFRLDMKTGTEIYLSTTEFQGAVYTTNMANCNTVDYTFSTDNEGVMLDQLSSEINLLDSKVSDIEMRIASLTGHVTNSFVSR